MPDDNRRQDTRREDDREWKRQVDHQLLTVLTSAQVFDRRLSELEDMLRNLDSVLRGDPAEELDGLVAQTHQIQTSLARLNAVVFVDSTGRKGLQKDVEDLKTGEHRSEYHLQFWAPVLVALISFVGLLATNWDRIVSYMRQPDLDPVAKEIQAALHPHRKHYIIHEPEE